jgi:ribose transport system substrate-binding protein
MTHSIKSWIGLGLALVVQGALLAAPAARAAVKPAPVPRLKVVMILKTLNSPYWKVVAAGARDAAKLHHVALSVQGPASEDAVAEQLQMVRTALGRRPDVLVFSPSQPAQAEPVLLQAQADHVPVILVDTGMPDSCTAYATFIGTDNMAAGRAGGKALTAILKQGDKVLLLAGAPGNPSMNERVAGAEEILTAYGLTVAGKLFANSDRGKAYSATLAVLQSQPDVQGVFAGNDEEALGALRAQQEVGISVPIIGVDANNENLKAILAGDLYGSIAQGNYEMGRLAIEKALELKAGKSVPRRIDSGATIITRANAQKLLDFRAHIQ